MNNEQTLELNICGQAAVDALIKTHPERVLRFFYTQDRAKSYGHFCQKLAEEKKIYRLVPEEEMEKISGSIHHQGLCAAIHYPVPTIPQEADLELWAKEGRTILVLDNLGNSHNLGTIVRTAAFLGIRDVVVCGRKGSAEAAISPSMYRTAEGGMEHCQIWFNPSAASLLVSHPFGKAGGILGLAADQYAKAEIRDMPAQLRLLPDCDQRGRPRNTTLALVMGNEEHGLGKATREACFLSARIGGSGLVESLNVALAASVFMYLLAPESTWLPRLGQRQDREAGEDRPPRALGRRGFDDEEDDRPPRRQGTDRPRSGSGARGGPASGRPPRSPSSQGRYGEGRGPDLRRSEGRYGESRGPDQRRSEGRYGESRGSDQRRNEGRPPRRDGGAPRGRSSGDREAGGRNGDERTPTPSRPKTGRVRTVRLPKKPEDRD